MAAAGELKLHGVQLAPFDVKYETARGWILKDAKRRARHLETDPEDAIELLRGRLLDAAAIGLERIEKGQKNGKTDWELMRQAARAMREIKAIPGRDKASVKPGQRDPATQQHNGGATRGGLAGSIVAASRLNAGAEGSPAPERPSIPQTQAENGTPDTGADTDESGESRETALPGSQQRVPVASRSVLLAQSQA